MFQLPRFPSNTREQIQEILEQVARDVEFFYVYSTNACPVCTLDPITDTSTDSFCPTCSGDYWIPIYSGVTMSGHITWKYDYKNEWETGGMVILGDAIIKVMHTDEREDIIKATKYIILDDKIMNVEKVKLLGAPAINRIIVDVKEKEEA